MLSAYAGKAGQQPLLGGWPRGASLQGPKAYQWDKALAWKSEEWGSNLCPTSWLCDLGQVTFPSCSTGSSPLNWGVRTVPVAQGRCRNHKLGTRQLLILRPHLPMWMRTCPRSPAESGLSPAQSPFIQGSFLAVASEAVFHSLPAQQCREVHARPVLTFHLCWLYSKILTERLQGPG